MKLPRCALSLRLRGLPWKLACRPFVCSISRMSALGVRQRHTAPAIIAMTSLTVPTAGKCRRLAGIGHRTCGLFYPSNHHTPLTTPANCSGLRLPHHLTVQRLREVFETFDTGIIPSLRRVKSLLQNAVKRTGHTRRALLGFGCLRLATPQPLSARSARPTDVSP